MVQFADLWRNHPINKSVITPCIAPTDLKNLEGEAIRKNYPVFPHQCAVRMGVCLHRSGVTVEQLPGLATCNVHPREQMHFINASSFADVLARSNISGVGKVERITGKDVAEYYPKLIGRTGLIYFRDYWYRSGDKPGQPTGDHMDLWNGYRTTAKFLLEWFSWLGYYSNYAGGKEIWFWPVE